MVNKLSSGPMAGVERGRGVAQNRGAEGQDAFDNHDVESFSGGSGLGEVAGGCAERDGRPLGRNARPSTNGFRYSVPDGRFTLLHSSRWAPSDRPPGAIQ